MNENLNLVEILEGCPVGTKFYSSIWGTVTFIGIVDNINYPIRIKSYNKINGEGRTQGVTKDGRYCCAFDGECTLFPAKNQRDWLKFERFWDKPKVEKFDPKTLHPFDKVLARIDGGDAYCWFADFVSTPVIEKYDILPCIMSNKDAGMIIPYNNDTKHLVGTNEEAPEYYRFWEE